MKISKKEYLKAKDIVNKFKQQYEHLSLKEYIKKVYNNKYEDYLYDELKHLFDNRNEFDELLDICLHNIKKQFDIEQFHKINCDIMS